MQKKRIVLVSILSFFFALNLFAQENFEECTVGVASGIATVDGRPLLWKNRDTNSLNNEVNYFTDGRFKYLALISAGYPEDAWAGVNEMGFCIMNSASNDLPGIEEDVRENGSLMKEALKNCVTVDDFEAMLQRTNATGRSTKANFGSIDAFGGCAFFETGQNSYTKFDANDPEIAPLGYIVRSNFAMTGGGSGGKVRFIRGDQLWKDAVIRKKLDYKFILRTVSRDLTDENGKPYPIPVHGKIGDNPRGTINTYATINRASTASTAVFHGVKMDENPSLTTFWVMLGEPIFSIAIPNWVIAESVAPELDGEKYSPFCTSVLEIKRANYYDYGNKRQFLITENLNKIWDLTFPTEDQIFKQTDETLTKWRVNYPKSIEVLQFHTSMASHAMQAIEKVKTTFVTTTSLIKVGVYADFGATDKCVRETLVALRIDPHIDAIKIYGSDVADHILDNLNAVIFPGGSGSREAASLGDMGRDNVKKFVQNGGAYIGICAGAYLGSDHPDYDWCLRLADAHVLDREHYARGGSLVKVKLTGEGEKFLPEYNKKDFLLSYYNNGPLLTPGKNAELEDYETLAVFESDVHLQNNSPAGVMPGSTFLLRGSYGKGKVVLCSGHPESTPGARWMIPRFVRWATQQKMIDYLSSVVKPDRFRDEILFEKNWTDRESELLKKLVSNDKTEKMTAMKALADMGSRDFFEWLPGQLRDNDLAIRKLTAELILTSDYLLATEDLEIALISEQDEEVKNMIQKAIDELKLK